MTYVEVLRIGIILFALSVTCSSQICHDMKQVRKLIAPTRSVSPLPTIGTSLLSPNNTTPFSRPHWVGDAFNVYPIFNNLAFTDELSPFLMLDYAAPKEFKPTTKKLGVGQHPHRGFETVTIALQGEVEHGDSEGNRDVIGAGDVQWMTVSRCKLHNTTNCMSLWPYIDVARPSLLQAASGIIHEEFHSTEFAKKGGTFEMIQLW
jgi:hypothetical protein